MCTYYVYVYIKEKKHFPNTPTTIFMYALLCVYTPKY